MNLNFSAEDFSLLAFTIGSASLATLITLPLGVLVGWWLAYGKGPGKGVLETLLTLPLVLPPSAVGLILLELLRRRGPLGAIFDYGGMEIVFTRKAVILACSVMSFPLLVRSIRTAFEETDSRLIGMARTLGRGPINAFLTVVLPLSWRGILSGATLGFSRALGEFGATIFIAGNIPGQTQTLALSIFQRSQSGDQAGAWRLVGIACLLAFAAVITANAISRKRSQRFLS